ncbi:hypothetical protein CRENBAI_011149 [Crenichthys baileyi]|uniref:Uncharacterized protein n=1 Tax=Crenichthys baileyi TaxID=28760 RepID=A0AAV9SC37_9TELE
MGHRGFAAHSQALPLLDEKRGYIRSERTTFSKIYPILPESRNRSLPAILCKDHIQFAIQLTYIWEDPKDRFWSPTLHLFDGKIVAIGTHSSPDSPPPGTDDKGCKHTGMLPHCERVDSGRDYLKLGDRHSQRHNPPRLSCDLPGQNQVSTISPQHYPPSALTPNALALAYCIALRHHLTWMAAISCC